MRWLVVPLAGLGTLVCASAWLIDRAGVVDDARPSEVLVVLGARVEESGAASPTLRARTEHAVTLYRKGLAPRLLFSGGVGRFGASEASVARDLAVQLGVPREACLLEEQSHSTAENAAFSAAVLEAHGLRSVVVVTDPYHLPRAKERFHAHGLQVTGSPVLNAPRHLAWTSHVYWTVREVFASLRQGAAGP